MKLDAYLRKNGITYATFAKQIGAANAGVVHKYASGKRYPRPRFMAKIVAETGGKVQPSDFFSPVPAE